MFPINANRALEAYFNIFLLKCWPYNPYLVLLTRINQNRYKSTFTFNMYILYAGVTHCHLILGQRCDQGGQGDQGEPDQLSQNPKNTFSTDKPDFKPWSVSKSTFSTNIQSYNLHRKPRQIRTWHHK